MSDTRVPPIAQKRDAHAVQGRLPGPLREAFGGRSGCDEQCEDQQDADYLDRLRDGGRHDQEEGDGKGAHRHATRFRDLGVDGREQQRPVDDRERNERRDAEAR